MTWTNEKPTAAGWYWYRDHIDTRIVSLIENAVMVRGELGIFDPLNIYYVLLVSESMGQFAGPIPKPEEATK